MDLLSTAIWACLPLIGIVLVLRLWRGQRPQRVVSPRLRDSELRATELELAQLRAKLQDLEGRYHAQLEFFVNFPELVKSLTAALTTQQATAACSRGLTAMLHTRFIAILLAESRTHLRLVDGAGIRGELRDLLSCPVVESGLAEAFASRSVFEPSRLPIAGAYLESYALPTELGVPIYYGDRPIGLLLIAGAQGEQRLVHRVLAMIADLTGVALHAAREVRQIRDEAERDALTGLANRRTLLSRLTLELQRCGSYQTRTSLAMIDVDHFKQYNDQHGHGAGDEVLRTVARLISSTTRRTDLVARYGGEEFTVVLVGADQEQAYQHADRIRRCIADHVFSGGAAQPLGRVSISVGLATYPDDAPSVERLFEAADSALYQAKHKGRNRVEQYRRP